MVYRFETFNSQYGEQVCLKVSEDGKGSRNATIEEANILLSNLEKTTVKRLLGTNYFILLPSKEEVNLDTFNFRQLGYSDEWLKNKISQVNHNNGIEQDYLKHWTSDNTNPDSINKDNKK